MVSFCHSSFHLIQPTEIKKMNPPKATRVHLSIAIAIEKKVPMVRENNIALTGPLVLG